MFDKLRDLEVIDIWITKNEKYPYGLYINVCFSAKYKDIEFTGETIVIRTTKFGFCHALSSDHVNKAKANYIIEQFKRKTWTCKGWIKQYLKNKIKNQNYKQQEEELLSKYQ